MFVQPVINPNYHTNYTANKTNAVSFKSANGARVLNQITKNNIRNQAGILEVLKKLGFGTLGVISLAKVAEILEEIPNEFAIMKNETDAKMYEHEEELNTQRLAFEDEKRIANENFENEKQTAFAELEAKKQTFEQKMKTAQEELESQKQAFTQEKASEEEKLETAKQTFANEKKAAEEKLESQRQAFAQEKQAAEDDLALQKQNFETYKNAGEEKLNQRKEQLNQREEALNKAECTLNEPEKNRIISATRTLYGLKGEELKSYDSYAEQLEGLNSLLSKQKDRVKTQDAGTLQSIVKTMQNKEGIVSNEMMKFVENIFSASEEVYVNELQVVIALAKDSLGNLDMEKAAAIVSELKTNTDNNSIKALINNIYSVSDLKDATINSEDTDKYNKLKNKIIKENEARRERDRKFDQFHNYKYTGSLVDLIKETLQKSDEMSEIADIKTQVLMLKQTGNNPISLKSLLGEEDFRAFIKLFYELEIAENIKQDVLKYAKYTEACIERLRDFDNLTQMRISAENYMNNEFKNKQISLNNKISEMQNELTILKLKTTNGDTAITKLSDKVEITKKESEDCCDGESLGVLLLKALFSCCGGSSCSSKSSSHSSYSSSYSSYSCSSGSSDKSASDDTPKEDNSNNLDSKKLQVFRRFGSSGYLPQESDFERAGIKLNETEKKELRMRHFQKEQSYRDYVKRSSEPGYNSKLEWDDDTHY